MLNLRVRIAAVAASVALVSAGCGGDSGDEGSAVGAAGDSSATLVLPFASCLSFYPLYVAENRGYFAEEGINVKVESAAGSAAANQAVLTGRGDITLTAPNELLAAAEKAPLVSFYSLYQEGTFSLFVPADSSVDSVEDLRDGTVGYSTPSGGDFTYMEGFLRAAGGLEPGPDYESIAVGDGANYALALRKKSVDAIAASFFAGLTVEAQGIELDILTDDDYPEHPDLVFAAEEEWLADNESTVMAFGRALAKGSQWGAEHAEETVDICSETHAEETSDRPFALAVHERLTEILELPEPAKDQWGYTDSEVMSTYIGIVRELGVVPDGSSVDTFSNDFIEAFNDYDPSSL